MNRLLTLLAAAIGIFLAEWLFSGCTTINVCHPDPNTRPSSYDEQCHRREPSRTPSSTACFKDIVALSASQVAMDRTTRCLDACTLVYLTPVGDKIPEYWTCRKGCVAKELCKE